MDKINYVIFEVLKCQLKFSNFLDFSLPNYDLKEESIDNFILDFKKEAYESNYPNIIKDLFTSPDDVNKSMNYFVNEYTKDNILKLKNNIKRIIAYNKDIIDTYETFNNILKAFTSEKDILDKIDSSILKLKKKLDTYFNSLLFFNMTNNYIIYSSYKSSKKSYLKEIVSIIKYANINKDFDDYIDIIYEDYDEEKLNDKLNKLVNICIKNENEKENSLNEVVKLLNNNLENK